jgi:hypothetical protein
VSVVTLLALVLFIVALVLLFAAAFGVVHSKVQLVPLALALALLAHVLRLWPP